MAHALLGILLLALSGAAGLHAQGVPPGAKPASTSALPVPDSTAALFHDSTAIITDPGGYPGRFLRNVVEVSFKEGTTDAQIQATVTLVQGWIVGHFDVLGSYYIRLPEHGQPITADSLQRVRRRLKALPQVKWVDVFDLTPKELD